jgi:hypothetical protein
MRTISKSSRRESGFATIAIIILLLAASAFMATTALTFRNLHKELRFVEKQQVQHWQKNPLITTNGVPVLNSSTNTPPLKP